MTMRPLFPTLAFLIGLGLLLALAVASAAGDQPLVYATYVGGNLRDQGSALAVDAAGNAYVAGVTESTSFPTGTMPFAPAHGVDAWAGKLNADGTAAGYLFWVNAATLFAEDEAFAIAVDGAGAAYVAGQTSSDDFCSFLGSQPGFDTSYNGSSDAFLFKIKPDGSGLDYCTFLGGNDWDVARAVAVDGAGNAYVVGGTWSTDFPITGPALQPDLADLRDAFVLKLDPAGTALAYSTYLGASVQDEATAITLDELGQAHVAGWTSSADFPTTPGVLGPAYAGEFDGFVARLSAAGDALAFSTYLGGSDEDRPTGIRLAAGGAATLSGFTRSRDFPVSPGAFQASHGGGLFDGFVVRLAPDAGSLAFSTYLGGADADWVRGIDLDGAGNSLVAGETWSSDFPTTTLAFQGALWGGQDAFVARLDAAGAGLSYSTYLGGSAWERGQAIAIGQGGNVFVSGATNSTDFPTTAGAFQPEKDGDFDAFVVKLRLPAPPAPYHVYLPLLSDS